MAKGGEPTHNLVLHYKTNRYTIKDVKSGSYNHFQMLSDVSDMALRDVPSNVSIYITMNLPIPGTYQTMEVKNDADLKTMFELYSKSETIHIILRTSQNPPLIGPVPEKMAEESILDEPGPLQHWLALDDVRGKGKGKGLVGEAEEAAVRVGPDLDLKKMAAKLRTQIIRTDGYEAGLRSEYRRDMRLKRAVILKAMGQVMAFMQGWPSGEPAHPGAGAAGDDAEIEGWLNLNDDSADH